MKSVAPTTNALNNPFKYTDPTGYQTASAPGAVSWLVGGGGWGENGRGFGGNVNWDYFVPNTSWHQYYGNYAYDTYNWSTGYYEHHMLSGVEETGFGYAYNDVFLPYGYTAEIKWMNFGGTDENQYKWLTSIDFTDGTTWSADEGNEALLSHFKYGGGRNLGGHGVKAGGEAGGGDLSNDIGFKINAAADKALILTNTNIYGAQKLAGFAAGEMTELTALTVLGRLTGVINIYYNYKQFSNNPKENWWNGVEAVGQAGAIVIGSVTGIEEIELI